MAGWDADRLPTPLMDEAVCRCGGRPGFMRDTTIGVLEDPSTHFWVCAGCGKPTAMYLRRYAEGLGFTFDTDAGGVPTTPPPAPALTRGGEAST